MKFLLVNPPYLPGYSRASRSPAVPRSGTLYHPWHLAQLAAILDRDGHSVLLVDAVAERVSVADVAASAAQGGANAATGTGGSVVAAAAARRPTTVIVAAAWPTLAHDLRAGEDLKRHVAADYLVALVPALDGAAALWPRFPGLDGIAPLADFDAVAAWSNAAHGGASAEAGTGGSIAAAANDRTLTPLRLPAGLRWRPGVATAELPPRLTAGELPWVAPACQRWLPLDPYFYACAPHPVVTLRTRLGCPSGCAFCVHPPAGPRRSPDDVVAELEWIGREWPEMRAVFFEDDTFTVDRQWLERFARLKLERKNLLRWSANARADLDRELLGLLAVAGCYSLTVGFESRSTRILKQMGKGLYPVAMERFAREAVASGILLHGCFILGWPGETDAEIRDTIGWACRLPLDTAQFYPPLPVPGTPLAAAAAAHGWIAPEGEELLDEEGRHRSGGWRDADRAARLDQWCARGRRRFYLHSGYWAYKLRQLLRDPDSRYRTFRSARSFLPGMLRDK